MSKEKGIFQLVLYAVALAMGVVSIVLVILKNLDIVESSVDLGLLLGIGVFCLALAELDKRK